MSKVKKLKRERKVAVLGATLNLVVVLLRWIATLIRRQG